MAIGVFNHHLKTIAGATSKSPEDAAKKLLGVLQKWFDTLEVPSDWEALYVRPPMMIDECSVVNVEEERLASFRRKS
ncbi:hypothetical protein N7517_009703 [Penicillium concentricum]|uniref:Uncharacterized protein n=1 Tax=Penicillium concentricum TaxID=293559 RepID=A0A9W9RI36_9EURO|nr:uncharacterized protein N7517_009703 [Penicillium concentricum]KAJ5360512.1 hypothetical protein N7517_009703 [Penicillium concentricum]